MPIRPTPLQPSCGNDQILSSLDMLACVRSRVSTKPSADFSLCQRPRVPRRLLSYNPPCHVASELTKPPVLRFAPSPTGQLHLGGLRTALLNHLFARRHGGRWILRIEDTDRKRLVPGAVEAMQDILQWAGLDYDEGPGKPSDREEGRHCVQSERLELYKKYAHKLLVSGAAYRDFRVAANDVSKSLDSQSPSGLLDQGNYISPSEEDTCRLIEKGTPFVVRLKMPKRTTVFKDVVYGSVRFPYAPAQDDPVLVKSDGWPTYHLASVVDDTDMQITHVFRGEEWLPSMPVHLALYDALSIEPPQFVHLPLLVNPDGSKLSKRHADVHLESYRQSGYLPEALINYVALMGYNWHDSDAKETAVPHGEPAAGPQSAANATVPTSEVFTMRDMIAGFSLNRISQTRATPNFSKLEHLNRQHMLLKLSSSAEKQRTAFLTAFIEQIEKIEKRGKSACATKDLSAHQIKLLADMVVGRSYTLCEAAEEACALFDMPTYDTDMARSMWNSFDPSIADLALKASLQHLARTTIVHVKETDAWLRLCAKQFERSLVERHADAAKSQRGRVVFLKVVRFALTADPSGPQVAELVTLFGKDESMRRIRRAIDWSQRQFDVK